MMCRLLISAFLCIYMLTRNPVIATSCYNCPKDANRAWKSDSNCIGNISDCGNCLEGFRLTGDICEGLSEIDIKRNESVFILPNSTVNFDCFFNEPVDCAWHRRGFHVLIGGRYTYKDDSYNGLNTKDCSITIRSFQDIDVGQWDCKSMASSYQYPIYSANAYLHMLKENIVIVRNNESASIPFGESVILQCYTDSDDKCTWQRRNAATQIGGRYSYFAEHSDVSADIRDCSILIKNFKQIDVGQWKCDIAKTSEFSGKNNAIFQLTKITYIGPDAATGRQANDTNQVKPEVELIEQPSSAEVLQFGSSVVLTCKFNVEVGCSWQKEGKEIEVMNNYHYINGKSEDTADCSIQINAVTIGDAGKWTCSNRGVSPEETITSNIAELTVAPRMVPPSPPEITLINPAIAQVDANRHAKRSLIRADDDFGYVCSSKNGNPAPSLYWQFANGEIQQPEQNITTDAGGPGVLYTTRVSIHFSDVSDQITAGANVLRCIAEHPAFDKPQMTVYVIEVLPAKYNYNNSGWTVFIAVISAGVLFIALLTIAICCFRAVIPARGQRWCSLVNAEQQVNYSGEHAAKNPYVRLLSSGFSEKVAGGDEEKSKQENCEQCLAPAESLIYRV